MRARADRVFPSVRPSTGHGQFRRLPHAITLSPCHTRCNSLRASVHRRHTRGRTGAPCGGETAGANNFHHYCFPRNCRRTTVRGTKTVRCNIINYNVVRIFINFFFCIKTPCAPLIFFVQSFFFEK